ncbi:MAG: hypothetical protein IJ218_03720 [Alphaproteobacteria bacterium]|nr:hypothetical protein [Alphaproteobacteria bacterium]
MKKILLFTMLFYANQLWAQNAVSSITSYTDNDLVQSDSLFMQRHLFEMMVAAVETEYDAVFDYIYPNKILATRSGKYYIRDVTTYDERIVTTKDGTDLTGTPDEVIGYVRKFYKSNDAKAKKTLF